MKECPILFSAPMVRAILDGRKTQTRRIIKMESLPATATKPYFDEAGFLCVIDASRLGIWFFVQDDSGRKVRCPYGVPGDRLWVRETFRIRDDHKASVCYRADEPPSTDGFKWSPAIFMTRGDSRITLEIVNVRVERLKDIDEADAEAEGVERHGPNDQHGDERSFYEGYRELWNAINAKRGYGWEKNPWVWVIEFCTLTPLPEGR